MRYPILATPELRAIESANAHLPLMERAGAAAAALAMRLQQGLLGQPLLFAGPGNNGGDAFVTARILKQNGFDPIVVFVGDPARLPSDAAAAYAAWLAAGGRCLGDVPPGQFGLLIDGLFGIGLTRPLQGNHAALITRINGYGGPVLALDIPSGLDADTGRVLGCAVQASHTLSFIALKPGLLTADGPDHCGEISVATLDIDSADDNAGRVLTPDDFATWLRPRLGNSHKGSYGSVGIIGGAAGMAGAALLAGRAALRLGAGRVYVGMLERLPFDPLQPELMLRPASEIFDLATVLAIGPGLGQSEAALTLLQRAVASDLPLVVDADALNLLATHPVLLKHIARRSAPTLMTPHPAEAARLLDSDTETVQTDRLRSARALSRRCRAAVVLKGCGSIVVAADGHWSINTSGNPGMASAGHGDVLTGIAAALLAQGWPAAAALAGAVHLHGCAADAIAMEAGTVGLAAGDVIAAARRLLNNWLTGVY
jgi:hydroxyethylthiazole kinase-like uncharacterized protein yjeF